MHESQNFFFFSKDTNEKISVGKKRQRRGLNIDSKKKTKH